MNVKKLECPHCRAKLDIGQYKHAEDKSLLCGKCGKVIFPITSQQEDTIPKNTGKAPAKNSWAVTTWEGGSEYD